MKKVFLIVLNLLFVFTFIFARDIKATTSSGKAVILKDDGTWQYEEKKTKKSESKNKISKPASATKKYESKLGFVNVWYDPDKWRIKEQFNGSSEVSFYYNDNSCSAFLLTEKSKLSNKLLRVAIEYNAKQIADEFEITDETTKIVNETELYCVQAFAKLMDVDVIYNYYCWTGDAGTVQFVIGITQDLYPTVEEEIFELLNGLEIIH